MDEKLQGAAEPSGPMFPLSGVHHSSQGARAVCHGGAVGMAPLGKGGWLCLPSCYVVVFIAGMDHRDTVAGIFF